MALWLLASVWCLLLLGGALRPWLGQNAALIACYAACTALVLFARPRRRRTPSIAGMVLAAASGFVALPAWLAFVALAGTALGLAVPAPPSATANDACLWLANVALAPLFEEGLYRERVLPALRARTGAPLALLLSSAAFAAPHLEPWSVLTTFCVGLALGGVFLATSRVELCIAGHAGLNAAALACGLPPTRAALPPLVAAGVASVLLGVSVWVARTRERRVCRSVHVGARGRAEAARRPA